MQKKIPIITQTSSLQLKNGTVKSNVLPAHQMVVFQEVQRPSTTYIRNLELRNAPGLDLIYKTPYWQKTLAHSTHFNILSLSMVLGCPINPDHTCAKAFQISFQLQQRSTLKKFQFFSCLCELNTKYFKKRIFIARQLSCLFIASTKHYGLIQDIMSILLKCSL